MQSSNSKTLLRQGIAKKYRLSYFRGEFILDASIITKQGNEMILNKDGFEKLVFHEKCDDSIRTTVLIKLKVILSGSENENGNTRIRK
ncbi:hypothetical protein Glove_13g81 [Diversispora epigaea]|uniref:Uncharacterized protein n=1 Tax=Diversispora epigaea TaxID=1348612 RepID=A0A397JS04_9GLOM|nr:hypothetical protein Glove_13g81 [Diversispora epigaea]